MNWSFLKSRLPLIFLLVWTVITAALVWQRVCESRQPPIYDALTYFEKAKVFWENASKGFPLNPLNAGNPGRPPGTVLMSYPFGFSNNYHGFLFRSVAMPFLIWIITILIIAWPGRGTNGKRSFRPAVLAVFLLGPMPFFFNFEFPAHSNWGLVDGFLASLAALAVACAGRSLLNKSLVWALASAVVAAFCPLVKPSGSLILLLTAVFWSGTALLAIFRNKARGHSAEIRFWLAGSAMFVLVGGGVSWLCLNSMYLSPGTISYFKKAMDILQNEFNEPVSLAFSVKALKSIFGPQLIAVVLLAAYFMLKKPVVRNLRLPGPVLFVAGILFLATGLWFWVFASGIAQIRYFYPFALMFVVPFVFLAFRKVYHPEVRMSKFLRWSIGIVCLLPAMNILGLLIFRNPNGNWQRVSGVNININPDPVGVRMAEKLLSEAKPRPRPFVVYSTNISPDNSTFNCLGYYRWLTNPSTQGYMTVHPFDWQHPTTYRILEILEADYIIFRPISPQLQAKYMQIRNIRSFAEEMNVIEAFLSSLKNGDGLQTFFNSKNCRLSKITNKSRLKAAFDKLLEARLWRRVFREANHWSSGKWEPFQRIYESLPPGYARAESGSCEGSIDIVNHLFPAPPEITTVDFVSIEGWMAYSARKGLAADEVFLTIEIPDGEVKYVATRRKPRPDVNVAFKQPAMADVGFYAIIDAGKMKSNFVIGLAAGYKGRLIRYNKPCLSVMLREN